MRSFAIEDPGSPDPPLYATLIGNHMLVISSDDDFNHDDDGNDDGEVNDDDDVELHQLCSLGGFCDLVEPHPSF